MNRPLTMADHPINIAMGWRLPSWLLDYGPVLVVALQGAVEIGVRQSGARAIVLEVGLAVVALALLARHRAPLATLAVVLVVIAVLDAYPAVTLAVLFAVFTVAEYADRRAVIVAALAAATVLVVTPVLHGHNESLPHVVGPVIPIGLAVAVGLYLRTRAEYVIGLHERAARLERERELLAAQAVAEERVRIARELHDVVAHNVSLMVVQAQALAATGGTSPAQRSALDRIAAVGREALSEMHRMLGVLRISGDGSADREPQPGVRDLDALIERTREAGLRASLRVEGEPRELPAGVDLSAYRIVQEALTNVIRHANARHAYVTLAYAADLVELTILDDGEGPPPATNGRQGGHGLVGMRERVALFGGELAAGSRPDRPGYRIHARLPLRG